MPKNGSRDLIRIGDRDGWVCGICRDPARPVHRPLGAVTVFASDLTLVDVPAEAHADEPREDVKLATRRYDPLAASIDHILPKSRGGTDDDGNLQITHLRCNLLKHASPNRHPSTPGRGSASLWTARPCLSGYGDARLPALGGARPPGEFADCLRPG